MTFFDECKATIYLGLGAPSLDGLDRDAVDEGDEGGENESQ